MKDILYAIAFRRMKFWTRSGLVEETSKILMELKRGEKVLSIGGYGATDLALEKLCLELGLTLRKLDIEKSHDPDILADISDNNLKFKNKFHAIVALEVLEHIPNYELAITNIYKLLEDSGIIILSTPWIIPVHDKPGDFYRFTHFELQRSLQKHFEVKIGYRGNYLDSVFVLGLRGLISGGLTGKCVFSLTYILTFFRKPPVIKFANIAQFPDSTIGYFVSGTKNISANQRTAVQGLVENDCPPKGLS